MCDLTLPPPGHLLVPGGFHILVAAIMPLPQIGVTVESGVVLTSDPSTLAEAPAATGCTIFLAIPTGGIS